jgi:uncharacterized membrane protein
MLKSRFVPVLVLLLMLSSGLPVVEFETLEPETVVKKVPANLETYNLFLDEEGDSGGDGEITTMEPEGAHKEANILSGVEFRSPDMISDLTIYGQGSATEVHLYIYLQFTGQEQSTADLTFTLNSVGGPTYTETMTLDDPCNSGLFNSDCSWTLNEVFFDIPEDGFKVEQGAQLRLQIDGSASCEGQQGGIGQGGDCEVLVAYGDVEQTNGFSRISMKANALSDSSVKVHASGGIWTDTEKLEWSPNHRPDFRTIQFSVDVRDAFGRDDINSINLVLSTPSGANSVFDKEFEDDDLRLDNNGLVGNYTWTYDAGMAPGHYNLSLEITDVQGHVVVYRHVGIDFMEYGMYLSLPVDQSENVLIAPGQRSSVEFMVEHTGSAGIQMDVEFELFTSLPSSWSDAIWDQPAGYSLNGGGSFKIATLSIDAPDGDLSTAPDRIEVWARGFVENADNVREEVVIEKIVMDIEEVGVFAPPRLNVYEDEEHQIQIADSNRPDAFDETLSHYIDSDMSIPGEPFYIDLFNAGFDTDTYRLKVEDSPSSSWTYTFFDNDTGTELTTSGPYSLTPDIGSHETLSLMMKIYPPSNRDDVDIGLFTVICFSAGDDQQSSSVSFTVHRTFGILAEVISDSDGQEIGSVGPVSPGSSVSFDVRITDSTDDGTENTWRIISPDKLDKNTNNDTGDPSYGTWDYSIQGDDGADIVAIQLMPDTSGDIEVTIDMREQVLAKNHTLYLRITEEVSEGDPRYFDLPLEIIVEEEVKPGRIFVERITEITPFLPSSEQNVEFRVENSNNVELDVIISAQTLPSGWSASFSTSGSTQQGNTILLEIPAFTTSEFTLILRSSDDLIGGKDAVVVLSVEPLDSEVSTNTLKQTPQFVFSTACEGISCITNAALDFESPQTIGLYVGILLVVFLAIYRRGQTSAREFVALEEEELTNQMMSEQLEDIPDIVTEDEDFDDEDDLELLDDLKDI